MSAPVDPYRDWGAAYVLGSLAPAQRREFEAHLGGCPDCAADVAALAGVPGLLSAVPRDRAVALLEPEPAGAPSVLPGLLAAERSRRRRARVLAVAAVVVAALAGAGVTALLRPPPAVVVVAPDVPMRQTVPSPVTASLRLVEQPWGTRIEVRCSYAVPTSGPTPPVFAYALYVVDGQGSAVQVATWTAGPGSTTLPVATTRLVRSDVTAVEIRLVDRDLVLLRVEL
ncbi:Anti-sigma-L factor RslA [Actinosynnema sp. ALI-1.44]